MSVTTAAVWEVRPATGSDNNGGMFKTGASGTDFSQQTSPQFALTGVTSSGAGNTVLTASAAATMVGNGINVVSGTNFNTGIYEITSVSVGVSITCSTNAAGQSISSGVGALGTMNVGGALATLTQAITYASANNVFYLKGTYTTTAAIVIHTLNSNVTNSDNGIPLTFNGYSTARDDGTRATWTTSTNNISLFDISSCQNILIKNINFTNTAGTKGTGANGGAVMAATANANNVTISQCSFATFTIGIYADFNTVFSFLNLQLDNVEVKSCTSHGVSIAGTTTSSGCFFHDNGGDGYRINEQANSSVWMYTHAFAHCVFYNNTGNGLTNQSNQVTGATTGGAVMLAIHNCAFVSNTGDGINSPANHSTPNIIWSSIMYGNGGYGINAPNVNAGIPRCNAYGANTTAARNNYSAGVGDVALSASPFNSPSTGDFSLNNTAGGGAACRAVGFPGVTSAIGTGYLDIGPLQHQDSGGGASGFFIQLNDTESFFDFLQLGYGLILGDNQSGNWGDSVIVGFISQSESLSDTLSLSDGSSIQVIIGFGPTDAITLTDAVLLAQGLIFNEQINLSDAIQLLIPLSKLVNGDFLILSDQQKYLLSGALSMSDTEVLTDSIGTGTGNIFTDQVTLSDAVVVLVNQNMVENLSDTLTLSDSVNVLVPQPLNNYLRRYLNDMVN